MTQDQFAVLVAGVATAVTFVQVVPQVVRLLRLKRTEGTSPSWAAIGMVINIGWIAYVIAEEFWVTIPAILAAVISFGVVLYLLWRNGADVRLAVISGIAVGVACVVLQRVAGWNDLGTVLGLSNGLYLGPSVYAAWRMYAPVGVAPLTWVLTAGEGILWGYYGVLVEAVPIVVYGGTAFLLAALILLRLWITRHRIRAELAPPD
ncbi:PQ-loop domain-containing transporter [Candidatus Poriferisodalis sp.]|uniref:PQ-loop domain-containing transporter n=1 Tax=Candidatus Poriferisodalis sp. TaxID=3101277 RepID=UPI003B522C4C